MVQKGQFLERATLIPAGKHTLEGLWHRGARAPAVLLVPPEPGDGSMDAAVLNELAFALSRGGHPSLRFNFAGVGASQGKIGDGAARVRDARAAAKVLRESAGVDALAVIGFRSAAPTVLGLAGEAVRLVLVSPPADLDVARLAACPVECLVAVGEDDPSRARWSRHCAGTGDRLAVIEGADAAWNRGLVQLGREVAGFVGAFEA